MTQVRETASWAEVQRRPAEQDGQLTSDLPLRVSPRPLMTACAWLQHHCAVDGVGLWAVGELSFPLKANDGMVPVDSCVMRHRSYTADYQQVIQAVHGPGLILGLFLIDRL